MTGMVHLVRSLVQEPDQLVLAHMLEAVSDVVDVVKPALLGLEQLGQAFQRFKVVLDCSRQRRHERLQRRHAEDFDQDEADAVEVSTALILCHVLGARSGWASLSPSISGDDPLRESHGRVLNPRAAEKCSHSLSIGSPVDGWLAGWRHTRDIGVATENTLMGPSDTTCHTAVALGANNSADLAAGGEHRRGRPVGRAVWRFDNHPAGVRGCSHASGGQHHAPNRAAAGSLQVTCREAHRHLHHR